jgi:hypothetical protein
LPASDLDIRTPISTSSATPSLSTQPYQLHDGCTTITCRFTEGQALPIQSQVTREEVPKQIDFVTELP